MRKITMDKGGSAIKHIANAITLFRIPLAIAMLFVTPFSASFWSFYLCGGFTDVIDGFIAKKLNQQSALGAKLDSIADFVFAGVIAIFAVINIEIPIWLWLCIMGAALLRFVSYGIGFYKYHTFAALHTCANKITGVLIFMCPILYKALGLIVTGVLLCTIAFFSALEEVLITVKSKELNRDCTSIFMR